MKAVTARASSRARIASYSACVAASDERVTVSCCWIASKRVRAAWSCAASDRSLVCEAATAACSDVIRCSRPASFARAAWSCAFVDAGLDAPAAGTQEAKTARAAAPMTARRANNDRL